MQGIQLTNRPRGGGLRKMKKIRHSLSVPTLVLGVALATLAVTPLMAQDWPMFGQNLANTATNQTTISTHNVGRLQQKWTFTTGGDVSARATVVDGVVYFPDWAGNLFAVNAETGHSIWSHQFSDYGLTAGTVSRNAPTIADGVLVYRNTVQCRSANRTNRVATGHQRAGWPPDLEDTAGYLELLSRDHELARRSLRYRVRGYDVERRIRSG